MILIKREKNGNFAYENGNKIAKIIVMKDDIMTTKVIPANGIKIEFAKKIEISKSARAMITCDMDEIAINN